MKRKMIVAALMACFALTGCGGETTSSSSGGTQESSSSSSSSSAHTHTYSSSWSSDPTYHWHAATCGHDDAVEKEKHSFKKKSIVEATYDAGGYTVYECSVCHYSYNGDETAKLEHTYSTDWNMDPTGHWHACTDEGYESLLTKDKAQHELVDNADGGQTCSICGYAVVDYSKYLKFKKNEDGESYSVSYCNSSLEGNLVIPSTYEDLPVTKISDESFSDCDSLISVVIPDSVTIIGGGVFYSCQKLAWVTLPKNLTSIGDYSFAFCPSLTSPIEIPASVTSIGEATFFGLNTSSIKVADGNTKYDSRDNCNAIIETSTNTLIAGCGKTVIPDDVASIGTYAFCYCSSLKSIKIPAGVVSIAGSSIAGCVSLSSITVDENNKIYDSRNGCNAIIEKGSNKLIAGCKDTVIPDDVVSIGDNAFAGCTGLKTIKIPSSVASIGCDAFSSCSSLTSIDIPSGVTSIGAFAFYSCSSLGLISIPDSLTVIADYAFDECSSLTSVVIPDGVTSIGYYAFSYCSALTSVTIGNGVTFIDSFAFYDCTSLTSVAISSNLTTIGYCAFSRCSALTSIVVPKSVTSIGEYAFLGCSDSLKIYFGGASKDWSKLSQSTSNVYYFTANGENETASGNWWYYDADNNIVEKVVK